MTETTTTTDRHAGATMCRAGNKTERPCWRLATETDIGETEPTLCPEHMEVRRLGEDLDARLVALDATRDFLNSESVEHDATGVLRGLVLGWLDSVTEAAADAVHKQRVAKFLAERGPGDAGPDNAIVRENVAHLYVRSDAIQDALTTLIDEREPSETERLLTIAALKEASRRAHEEHEKFCREQGLRG